MALSVLVRALPGAWRVPGGSATAAACRLLSSSAAALDTPDPAHVAASYSAPKPLIVLVHVVSATGLAWRDRGDGHCRGPCTPRIADMHALIAAAGFALVLLTFSNQISSKLIAGGSAARRSCRTACGTRARPLTRLSASVSASKVWREVLRAQAAGLELGLIIITDRAVVAVRQASCRPRSSPLPSSTSARSRICASCPTTFRKTSISR